MMLLNKIRNIIINNNNNNNKIILSSLSSSSSIIIPNRIHINVSGIDSKKFLQGICTNDINKLEKHGDCIAAAFLTPNGRIVADALLYYINNNSIIIETHLNLWKSLDRHLRVYKLRSKVEIETLQLNSILDVDNLPLNKIEDISKSNNAIVGAVDPRTSDMGTRFLVHKNINEDNKIDNYKVWYDRFRLLRGIAEGPTIVDRIPLECNLDFLNYISFSKGCYVGQELTARTKYKGLVRKRIIPFIVSSTTVGLNTFNTINNENIIESKKIFPIPNSSNNNIKTGEYIFLSNEVEQGATMDKSTSIGEIVDISKEYGVGLSMMRLSNILSKENDESKKFITSNNVIIETFRPSFFPSFPYIDPTTGKAMIDE